MRSLTGKIDKMRRKLNEDGTPTNELIVFDYKTGRAASSWDGKTTYEKIELHEYKRQLIFYKLLVENSREFSDKFKVNSGILQFMEPTSSGDIVDLSLAIEKEEAARLTQLIVNVYKMIINIDFPDVSHYSQDLSGVLDFEEDILKS